jgi:hypothetical protein
MVAADLKLHFCVYTRLGGAPAGDPFWEPIHIIVGDVVVS